MGLRDLTEGFGAMGLATVGYALPILVAVGGFGAPTARVPPPEPVVEVTARMAPSSALPEPVAVAEPVAPVEAEPARVAMVAPTPTAPRSPEGEADERVVRRVEPSAAPPPQPAPTPSKGNRCDPRTDSIVRVGTSTFAVDRELIRYYATHPARLDDLGFVARHEGDDGKVVGFRLGGIRCGSELHLAGLRNGDVVRSINGHRVRNIAEGLLLYTRLKNADVIQLEVERKGTVQRLDYRLG